jgi:hypothetical protein
MLRTTNPILVPKTRDEALASVATMPPEVHQGLDASWVDGESKAP